jgi:hypothetical protein
VFVDCKPLVEPPEDPEALPEPVVAFELSGVCADALPAATRAEESTKATVVAKIHMRLDGDTVTTSMRRSKSRLRAFWYAGRRSVELDARLVQP